MSNNEERLNSIYHISEAIEHVGRRVNLSPSDTELEVFAYALFGMADHIRFLTKPDEETKETEATLP